MSGPPARDGGDGALTLPAETPAMATALNLTAPLKQDPETRARLHQLAAAFAEHLQPLLEAALSKSEVVHYARVLVIDDTYLQVLTEFDGDPMAYTEFFRKELGPVFQQIFSLVEGAPPWEELDEPNAFFEFARKLNLKALGRSTDGDDERGYLFSAIGDTTVREIKQRLQPSAAPV
jgi:hypothetical protein